MKKLLFVIFLGLLFSAQSQEQTTEITTQKVDTKINHQSEWTIYEENSELKIEYKFVDCDPAMGYDKEVVLIRVSNLSADKLQISWNSELEYDGSCNTCNYPEEYFTQFSISSNNIIEVDCDLHADTRFRFFSKFIDVNYTKGATMTAFKLANLTINK